MYAHSNSKRRDAFAQLTAAPLDLLIIGGGIVGSGVARDAAMRGLRVGLVDQHDFAAGTSSRSSRLLHGGLRILSGGTRFHGRFSGAGSRFRLIPLRRGFSRLG